MSCKNKTRTFIIPLLVLPFLFSCSVERKLAREFLGSTENVSVLVFPPNFLYKANLKAYEVPNAKSLKNETLDSILYNKSLFVQYVSDSVFLENYVNSFITELRNRHLNVFLPADSDLFFNFDGEKFVVDLAQVLLEEDVEDVHDKSVDLLYYYGSDLLLNRIKLNAWFEISGVNESNPKKQVAFSEVTLTDILEGRLKFFPYLAEFKFVFTIDTIETQRIYEMAAKSGEHFAGYLSDYMMNRYIDHRIAPGRIRESYLRYDANIRKIKPANDQRFTILE